MRSRHPDDFTLLRWTAGDVDDVEREKIGVHVDECEACFLALAEIQELDQALRSTLEQARFELGPNDPFRARPPRQYRSTHATLELADRARSASERGSREVESLFAAVAESPDSLERSLRRLSLADPAARYLLLYALEEAGRRVTEGPTRCLRFAEEVLRRLESEAPPSEPQPSEAEVMVPLSMIAGQARLTAGQACNWTGALEVARRHFEEAYRSFPSDSVSDEIRLALTEFHESQRRTFAGRPGEGLILARRARETFERFGLQDFVVRARVAEGIALSALGRDEEAIAFYRVAVPFFEAHGLSSNYASAVNSLGASLARLGRLDEARREYSRALRRVSRERHPSILAAIRNGLAVVLFSARRYADAAKSFLQAARMLEELDLTVDALTASLWEIESWARSGDTARALHRFEIFRTSVLQLGALDPFFVRQLEEALTGRDADFERLAEIRQRAERSIREKLRAQAG